MKEQLRRRLEALEGARRPPVERPAVLVYGPDEELLSEWRWDAAHPFGHEVAPPLGDEPATTLE